MTDARTQTDAPRPWPWLDESRLDTERRLFQRRLERVTTSGAKPYAPTQSAPPLERALEPVPHRNDQEAP